MPIVKLLRGGQVTLPAELRQRLGLVEGSELLVTLEGEDGLMLRVLPAPGGLDDLMGCLRPDGEVDVEDARGEARAQAAERFEERTVRALAREEAARREEAASRA